MTKNKEETSTKDCNRREKRRQSKITEEGLSQKMDRPSPCLATNPSTIRPLF